MKVKSKGSVGKVYTTQAGWTFYKLDNDEGEGKEGWMQINSDEREFVKRKRLSHSAVMWVAPQKEESPPMSHLTDGALF